MSPLLYGRLIARWRHGRWCHRCEKGPCFYSTRVPTGCLLVTTNPGREADDGHSCLAVGCLQPQHYVYDKLFCHEPFQLTDALRRVGNERHVCLAVRRRHWKDNDTIQYNTMRCDTMRCDAVRCGATRCDAMLCDAMRCDAMRCDAMRCDAMQCKAMRCKTMRCDATRHDTTQYNTASFISNIEQHYITTTSCTQHWDGWKPGGQNNS